MTSEQYHRTVCDHCGMTVEVSTMSAYYTGRDIPTDWVRLTGIFDTGKYHDLCPMCVGEFQELVEDWLKGVGYGDEDHPLQNIGDTCCGDCAGDCYVDRLTGA